MSWILLFGMVVALSFVLYNWSIDQAKARSEEIKSRSDPLVCSEIGISIKGYCQDSRSLQMNISNTNNHDISNIQLRLIGLYPEDEDYLNTKVIDFELSSGDTEKLVTLKKGTLSQFTVIPVALRDGKMIYCEDQAIKKEGIRQC